MEIKISNALKVLKDQMPLKRFISNLLKGKLKGILHIRSHIRHAEPGEPVKYKMQYTKALAKKAAARMGKKHNTRFDVYKCLYCDFYHIGKYGVYLKK